MPTSSHPSKIPSTQASVIRETAHSFLQQTGFDCHSKSSLQVDAPCLDLIDQLCNWSFSPEPLIAKVATSALFGSIIEPLCDDFSDHGVQTANLVLTRILQFIRATPEGAVLNSLLNDFGFTDATSLLNRYQRLQQITPLTAEQTNSVKKILVLSRVTAGADIAITNVIIHRLRLHFASAELVLIGPAHLPEVFAFVENCRHRNFLYKNDGSLFDKMSSWPSLLEITMAEQEGFLPEEILLFDPDTRLSQLGLLPLAPDNRTCYFPSRASRRDDTSPMNLSCLANLWLNQLLDEEVIWQPNLIFERKGEGYHTFCQALHKKGCQRVVVVNFGVGNNPRKKVHGNFEEELIEALLAHPKTIVILDTGRGQHKGQWMADHLARARTLNFPVICLHDSEIPNNPTPLDHGLIIFNGSLGSLGKMIDAADCFIGYDSCGQHLAAATSTPAIIIFAGAPSTRFIHRWSPDAIGNLTIPFNSSTAASQEIRRLIVDITQAIETIQPKA
ncbi:MAG: glycosyltransferase family 9 protein [Desulfobulbaceae bacterium]|nr:glycosyltransferase family 9 protein [Desulfobulbaceae bacterium]